MTGTARAIALGAAVLAGAVALAGCGLRETRLEDTATLTTAVTSVRIDDDDGGVTLRGVAGATGITVHRTITYQGSTAPSGTSFHADGGVLTLSTCGQHCSVAYSVELPAGLPVSGSVDDGGIDLSGVGAVRVRTDNGAITLDDVHGSVDVRTGNGHVVGRRLDGGAVQAVTDNGQVELTTRTPQDVRVQTANGAVAVAVAPGRYVVDTTTDAGSEDVRVPNDPTGEHRIQLATDNGAITVTPA